MGQNRAEVRSSLFTVSIHGWKRFRSTEMTWRNELNTEEEKKGQRSEKGEKVHDDAINQGHELTAPVMAWMINTLHFNNNNSNNNNNNNNGESVTQWFRTVIIWDVSSGLPACPFTHLLAPLTHSLTLQLVGNDQISQNELVLSHSAAVWKV